MRQSSEPSRIPDASALVLGYFNFSSGSFDAAAWRAMSDLFAVVEPLTAATGRSDSLTDQGVEGYRGVVECPDASLLVAKILRERLSSLAASEPAFRDSTQAKLVIEIVFSELLPAYRAFHCDLLEHQPPGAIERPFILMAAAQALNWAWLMPIPIKA